jgi:hypothetical protein
MLIGLAMSGLFAFLGLRTFEKWRREKIEERKIEIAFEALTLSYESTSVFDRMRARYSRSAEWADMPAIEGETEEQRTKRGTPYSVLQRIENHKDFFERVWKLQPRYIALFGAGAEDAFANFHSARRKIEFAAYELMWELEPASSPHLDQKEIQRLKAIIYGRHEENDEVGKLLDSFRHQIDDRCRPIVDSGYGKEQKSPATRP